MSQGCLLEIDCRIRPEKRREFVQHVSRLLCSAPHRSKGVLYEDQGEPGHVLWVQEWRALHQLEQYLASDDFLTLLGGFQVLGMMQDCRIVDLSTRVASGAKPAHPVRTLSGLRRFHEHREDEQ
jgi:hypothetical protein